MARLSERRFAVHDVTSLLCDALPCIDLRCLALHRLALNCLLMIATTMIAMTRIAMTSMSVISPSPSPSSIFSRLSPSFSSRLVKDTDISLAAKRVSAVRAQDIFVPSQYYRSLATRAGEGRCRTVCGAWAELWGLVATSGAQPRRISAEALVETALSRTLNIYARLFSFPEDSFFSISFRFEYRRLGSS